MTGTFSTSRVFKTRTSVFRDKAVVVGIEVVEIVVVVVVKKVVDVGPVVKAVVGVVVVNVKARGQHILIELKCTIEATVINDKKQIIKKSCHKIK